MIRSATGLFPLFTAVLFMGLVIMQPLSNLCAQEVQEGKIDFETTTADFGTVADGQIVEKEFKFKNSGNSDLKILKVLSTCGCTAAAAVTEAIGPGMQSSIKVSFDSDGFSGKIRKIVRVQTTDRENPEVTLTIDGNVERSVELFPSRISFVDVISGKSSALQNFEVRLKSSSGKKLKAVNSYSKYLTIVELPVKKDHTNGFDIYPYSIELNPKVPEGSFRDRIIVELQEGKKSVPLNVPVLAQVEGAVVIEPKQLSFGLIQGQKILEKQIRVQLRGDKAMELTDVSSDTPGLDVQLTTIEKSKIYVIKVSLDPQKIKSDFRGLVRIETSDSDKAELLVSVFGVVPPRQNF